MIELNTLKDTIAKTAKTSGIDTYDFYSASSQSKKISVQKGEIDNVAAKDSQSCILRVWKGSKVGCISTNDLTESGIQKAFDMACATADLGLGDVTPRLTEASIIAQEAATENVDKKPSKPQKLIQTLVDMEQQILNADKRIQSVPYNAIVESFSSISYINSLGSERTCDYSSAVCYLYTLAGEEGKKTRKGLSFEIANNLESLDTQKCVEEAKKKTLFHLDYVPFEPQPADTPVVFEPEAFLTLFGSFANIWNGRSVLDKKSLSNRDSIGKNIASAIFNFTDDPHHEKNLHKLWFDQEGVLTKPLEIIKEGTLKSFIHNEETARIFETTPTGHAVTGSRPGASTHFYDIRRSNENVCEERLMEEQPSLVCIENVNSLHAGIQALQGSFSLPVDGWFLKNGKKTSFESAVISGDILDLLQNITYMSQEREALQAGICPHVWTNGIKVSG